MHNNPRFSRQEKDDASQANYEAEQRIYTSIHQTREASLEALIEMIDEIRVDHTAIVRATNFFIEERRHYTRFTTIDSALGRTRIELLSLSENLELLVDAAVHQSEDAKRRVYERILGDKLEQLDAPYLFDVVNFVVDLLAPAKVDTSENARESLALLVNEATSLAGQLAQTNVDRRLVAALHDYISALTETNFSPIKVDLFSNKLRFYLTEMRDEIPGFALAEMSALLLSQERVLRQFPVWRSFENDASQFSPNEQLVKNQHEFLDAIASETRSNEGIASDRVLDAFGRLEQTAAESSAKKTTELGVWRAVENFVKTNIKQIIDVAKTWQRNIPNNQARYVRYLERLLPHLKLYVTMNENLTWLLPVIHWLEESIKTMK